MVLHWIDGHGAFERTVPLASIAVEHVLNGLGRRELSGFRGCDRDRFAGLGITALTLAALGNPEAAETGDADLVAPR